VRTQRACFIAIAVFVAVLLTVFIAVPDQCAYAKGARRSSDSSSDRSSSSSSKRGSERENSSSPPPSSSSHSEERAPSTPSGRSSAPYFGHSDLGLRSNVSLRNTEQREPRNLETRGLHRRNYEDIGRIWKERRERRDSSSDHRQREYSSRDHDTHINVIYHFPGRYRYYCYDYTPGLVYPSVYCYYYGLFPPYIPCHRAIFISRNPRICYSYTDLPIIIADSDCCDYDCGYYLSDRHYRSLSTALRDIRRAWELGDIDLLTRHVRQDSTIDVFLGDEYAYSVNRLDYCDMTLDAMKAIRTVSFKFYRVRKRCDYEAVAYGKHVYRDDYDDFRRDGCYYYYSSPYKTVYVSYTLKRYGSDWYITEVGTSPYSRLF